MQTLAMKMKWKKRRQIDKETNTKILWKRYNKSDKYVQILWS